MPNVVNGKIVFKSGTSAEFILNSYRKHTTDKKKIRAEFDKAITSGKFTSTNPAYRVSRIITEITKREKAGFAV